MTIEPIFLSAEEVVKIHRRMIETFGEETGRPYDDTLWVRDEALLQSAVFAPQATFGGEFFVHVDRPHGGGLLALPEYESSFEDGNKRVALATTSIFLRINGFKLTFTNEEAERITLEMASGNVSRDEVMALVEANIAPIYSDPVDVEVI